MVRGVVACAAALVVLLAPGAGLAQTAPVAPTPAEAQEPAPAAPPKVNPGSPDPAKAAPPRPADGQLHPLTPPPMWLIYTALVGLAVFGFFFLFYVAANLGPASWSLSDALSEEVSLPWMVPDQAGVQHPDRDAQGAVILVPQMRASTSRLIALMGMFGILMLYTGFGLFTLYYFATGQGAPPGVMDVVKFLVAGLTLFAPYVVNKFAGVFESLSPSK